MAIIIDYCEQVMGFKVVITADDNQVELRQGG